MYRSERIELEEEEEEEGVGVVMCVNGQCSIRVIVSIRYVHVEELERQVVIEIAGQEGVVRYVEGRSSLLFPSPLHRYSLLLLWCLGTSTTITVVSILLRSFL